MVFKKNVFVCASHVIGGGINPPPGNTDDNGNDDNHEAPDLVHESGSDDDHDDNSDDDAPRMPCAAAPRQISQSWTLQSVCGQTRQASRAEVAYAGSCCHVA